MNLAAILLLPRLLTGGTEPANAVKLAVVVRKNSVLAKRPPFPADNRDAIRQGPALM